MLTEIPADRLLQINVYQDPRVKRICNRETNIAIMLIYRIVWDLLMLQSDIFVSTLKVSFVTIYESEFFYFIANLRLKTKFANIADVFLILHELWNRYLLIINDLLKPVFDVKNECCLELCLVSHFFSNSLCRSSPCR